MPVKTVDVNGTRYATLDEAGLPVFILSDGAEVGYDGESLATQLSRVNSESASRRHELNDLKTRIEAFGDLDPAKAKEALETVAGLDGKQVLDAAKLKEIRESAAESVKASFDPLVQEHAQLKQALHAEKIGGAFTRSEFIKNKTVVPAAMIEATFGRHFSLQDGKMVATDANGNSIYSRKNPGEVASFEEAIEQLISNSPMRDSIMKARNPSGGSGALGGGTRQTGGVHTITREDASNFQAYKAAKEAAAKAGAELRITG